MKCPFCGNEVSDALLICPYCNSNIKNTVNTTTATNNVSSQVIQVKTQVVPTKVVVKTVETEEIIKNDELDEANSKKKDDLLFFKIIIIVGVIIFLVLLLRLFFIANKDDDSEKSSVTTTKEAIPSNNVGLRSTYSYPMNIGDVTLASLYDDENKKYTDVDVYANRYITDEELNYLVATYASQEMLKEGFYWRGLEYTVKLNDLIYLKDKKVSPVLDSYIYQMNGNDFFLVGDHYYKIETTSIYDGEKIGNGESAVIKVIFQVPFGIEAVICFGQRTSTMGCFR